MFTTRSVASHNSYPANWDELRQQQLEHDGHRCRGCGITAKQLADLGWGPLQVHHINEGPPNYAGPYHREVVGENLMTLCADCHDGITDSVRRQRFKLSPSKQVDVRVADPGEIAKRETAERAKTRIKVSDAPAARQKITSKRGRIRLFSD